MGKRATYGRTTPPVADPAEAIPKAKALLSLNHVAILFEAAKKIAPPPIPVHIDCDKMKCQYCVDKDIIITPRTCITLPTAMIHRGPYESNILPVIGALTNMKNVCSEIIHPMLLEE